MKKLRNFFRGTYLGLMLIFLYAPILVLMVFSFNGSTMKGRKLYTVPSITAPSV